MESPFEVLRLDADADEEELEQAYRARVKEAHPDQGGSVEEFQTVRRAYEKIKAGYSPNGTSPAQEDTDDEPRAEPQDETRRQRDRQQDESDAKQDVRTSSEVTYLNYDVLSDFGWRTDDEDLFRKAAKADLDEVDFGRFVVEPGQSLLEAAEERGFEWPFACRGGACANCAIMLLDGELSMPASHVLSSELMEQGIRLSCNGVPITEELNVVYNVKHMPELEDLLLPPDPFEHAYSD
ncbi:ferredoxin Fer [Halorussus lipolyticus]|uniref:ferredoxin Fer n=1 Tax=Halorussus lipolyticus TaxID=3034024 RepID=UPI0023E7C57C|nr:ferredoxin Fer [Halorussus sp. DT80]